ncbi:MAG: hypothetical protein NT138_06680 [Planctomycetales bacterium]|jgi:hypothetical protein|nr:hypothetical protein [Planctomycetales bacterium]
MSYNPFEAPATNSRVVGIVSGSREDLLKVAKYQKGILVCILVYILAVAGQFALPPQIRPLVGLGVLVVGLIAAVFTIRLAMKTHGTILGIILGVLCLVPILGLLILLLVNQKATTVLQLNGIKVGLLGADLSSL